MTWGVDRFLDISFDWKIAENRRGKNGKDLEFQYGADNGYQLWRVQRRVSFEKASLCLSAKRRGHCQEGVLGQESEKSLTITGTR